MKNTHSILCVFFFMVFVCFKASADLSNPTYKRAHEAYIKKDWSTAITELKKYQSDDQHFLSNNAVINDAVSQAVSFCSSMLPKKTTSGGVRIIGGGMSTGDHTIPELPEPTAATEVSSKFPAGYGMLTCGCWGRNPPYIAVETRCSSGYVILNICPSFCTPFEQSYSYVCQ